MGGKREKPEDIVLKLRQVEVLQGQQPIHSFRKLRVVLAVSHFGASLYQPFTFSCIPSGFCFDTSHNPLLRG